MVPDCNGKHRSKTFILSDCFNPNSNNDLRKFQKVRRHDWNPILVKECFPGEKLLASSSEGQAGVHQVERDESPGQMSVEASRSRAA